MRVIDVWLKQKDYGEAEKAWLEGYGKICMAFPVPITM